MAHVVEPFVSDSSTTTGVGDFTVAATPPFGQRTLSAVLVASDTFHYSIRHTTAFEFEEGVGTYTSANVFARTTVMKSSSISPSNGAVSFSAGTKSVALVHPSFALVGPSSVVIGGTTADGSFLNGNITPALQVLGIDFSTSAQGVARFSADSSGPRISMAKSRSAATGGYAIVQADDVIGELLFEASDGTNFAQCVSIRAVVDGTPGNNDMPARLLLMTSPDGSQAPQERLRIDSTGLATFTAPIKKPSYLTAALPSASTSGAGACAFVTDSNLTMTAGIGTVVVGTGGSPAGNKVPVYSDGTNWLIG